MIKKFFCVSLLSVIVLWTATAQNDAAYMLPPSKIVELVDAPRTPSVSIVPEKGIIMLVDNPDLPALSDLAAPELRLAGIRFNPLTNGPSQERYGISIHFMNLDGSNMRTIEGLPDQARITNLRWSADNNHLAFTHTSGQGIELWVIDVDDAKARRLTGPVLNGMLGTTFVWLPDNTILFARVPEGRGAVPQQPAVASAPMIQQSLGQRAAVRTFQDMLKDEHDQELFDYYANSQLMLTDLNGHTSALGEPAVFTFINPSPDGNYILLTRLQRPYSYIVPANRFSRSVDLIDRQGNLVRQMADIPLLEVLPQGRGATQAGRRSFTWRTDAPATLYWVEALDGGDPSAEADYRDQLWHLDAPFSGEPTPSHKTAMRYGGITWGRGDFALLAESWPQTRMAALHAFEPDQNDKPKKLILERSTEDRYSDPGDIQTVNNEYGRQVIQFDRRGRKMFLIGTGASPEGNRPFVDTYDIRTGKTERLWRSQAPYYENPIALVDPDKGLVITRRESEEEHPNIFLRDIQRNKLTRISDFPDPFPALRNLQKQMIHYEREDGIPLSGTLFLPEGFTPGVDEPLPTILYAYPREFLTADAAGQVSGSPYTYTRVGATSVVMLATQGYAVLNSASFPIVAVDGQEPNDTFVEQLVANAEAAINTLVEMGVTDPKRVGVSGHSYGAFMTANLLSHSNLFAAGVARSGAYNRTLTPFGFQSEERTYWQAPDVYNTMSPFMQAHNMQTPMLLIHGAEDNNTGTFPMQSERYYDALRGLGATVRLVMLPHESHGYNARESVLHMHWEWLQWFDRYVKKP